MVNCAEKTNNCIAARKFHVVKANVWQWRKQAEANKLKNLPVEYSLLVRQWELAKWHNTWHNLKASVGLCAYNAGEERKKEIVFCIRMP